MHVTIIVTIMQQREISLTHPAWTAALLAVAHQLQVYIESDYSYVTAKIDSLIYLTNCIILYSAWC